MDPNDILKNPEQIKALISLLQGLVNQITPEKDKEEQTKNKRVAPSKPSSTIKTRGGQKVGNTRSIKSKKIQIENTNEFEKMAEFRMHKDDCVIDKKLCSNPPVARMRDFDFIDVLCRVCGKKESVAPTLLHDSPARYKCNTCSTQSG